MPSWLHDKTHRLYETCVFECVCHVVVWNCSDEECGICNVLCDCCVMWKMMQCVVMSDVAVWCKIKMRWCNAMWNMVWCEICCDVECQWVWCGIIVDVEWCEMWTVAVWCGTCALDVVVWNGGAEATCRVMWSDVGYVLQHYMSEMWRGTCGM